MNTARVVVRRAGSFKSMPLESAPMSNTGAYCTTPRVAYLMACVLNWYGTRWRPLPERSSHCETSVPVASPATS